MLFAVNSRVARLVDVSVDQRLFHHSLYKCNSTAMARNQNDVCVLHVRHHHEGGEFLLEKVITVSNLKSEIVMLILYFTVP